MDDHHTNGLDERRIRNIQDNGRAMMVHAQYKCTEFITAKLWPYALRYTNNAYNSIPLLEHPQGWSTLQIFIETQVQENPKQCNPFGLNTYFPNEALCSQQKIHHKWKSWSLFGTIYLTQPWRCIGFHLLIWTYHPTITCVLWPSIKNYQIIWFVNIVASEIGICLTGRTHHQSRL